jgi:hypothetical protein
MIVQRSVFVLAAALLLAAGSVWAAPPDDSNAGERAETPRAEPQESPSEPPPQAQAPDPPSSPEPSAPPSDSGSGGDDSSAGSPGHTAVPIGPDDHAQGPNRQPPTQHSGGGHGHGDGGVPYGGEDGDGYDSSQGAGYPLPAPSHGGSSGSLFHGSGRRAHDDMGALDLDITPGRAQVFLDGQRIGEVDDFDGWPKYLWLPEGTYDLVFYLDGYQTLGRQVTVQPGLVIDMDDRLQPGRAILPEDFQPEPGD